MRQLPVFAAFSHAWRSTFNNLGFAFNLSWPWMLVILPVNVLGNVYALSEGAIPGEPNGTTVATSFIIGLLTVFAFASIAVSWHRYILRDEMPRGWARLRADNTVWRYFGNSILVLIMLVLALVPVVLLLASLAAVMGQASVVLIIPGYVAAVVASIAIFYRLSVKLPAIALERTDYSFSNAWNDTRGNFWQLVGLGLLFGLSMLGMAVVLALLIYAFGSQQLGLGFLVIIALEMALNWFVTIMGVTILTSLYGFFVEGRDF